MATRSNFYNFFFKINRKRRLSLRKVHNDSEVWYMHISPLEIIGGGIAILLILFIIILSLVAYTPILKLIPGYSGNKMREQMIENIIKVDSIERKLNELQIYYSNVSLIMEGKTPITRNVQQAGDSIRSVTVETVHPSREDSILRRQLEGQGIYGLGTISASRHNARPGMELLPPVQGIIAEHFDPKEEMFGIAISTATNQQVLAVADGTIIFSSWIPNEGYSIQVQHAGNLISIYRNASESFVSVGARVKGGDVISSTGDGISGEGGKGFLGFELWQNGSPIDPENFIVF